MISCTRRIQFCAGHRVLNHESKCRNLHGHNYVAFVTAEAEGLDPIGRVIDFSVLKEKVGGWIEECWDHGLILYERDTEMRDAVRGLAQQKLWVGMWNPTAENMAEHLLRWIGPLVLEGTGVKLTSVVLWETENCHAEAKL